MIPLHRSLRVAVRVLVTAAATVLAATFLAVPAGAVVGGDPTPIGRFGYAVYLTNAEGKQFCGGSLVKANKVVTAAHCVDGWDPADLRVVAGRADKAALGTGTTVKVTSYWVHPEWEISFHGADLAVLTLSHNLWYSQIALATPADQKLYVPGTDARVLGWGAECFDCPASPVLRTALIKVIGSPYCNSLYEEYTPTMHVCAGLPLGGRGTCQGDSGGPLVAGGKLIGVTSWGHGCGEIGKPPVFMRLSQFHQVLSAQL